MRGTPGGPFRRNGSVAGLDVVGRQRSRLANDKHAIECELMELMTGPDKAAIHA